MKIVIIGIIRKEVDIDKWKEYHKKLGVTDFILYNDLDINIEGVTPIEEICLYPFKQKRRFLDAYINAWALYKNQYDFMTFIDPDEYIITKDHKPITDYLIDDSKIILMTNYDKGLNSIRSIVNCHKENHFTNNLLISDGKIDLENIWISTDFEDTKE